MKLKDDAFKLQSTEEAGFYARALRVIGQDLADLFPERLEIEKQGDNFTASGQCSRSRLERHQPKDGWTHFKELLSKDLTELTAPSPQTKSESVSFARAYDPEDINRLDALGAHRRAAGDKIPDIRSLGEMLRTVGRLVDAENGRLIRMFKDQRRVTFEYEKSDGTRSDQEVTSLELYKLQQRYYAMRGKTKILDLWNDRA